MTYVIFHEFPGLENDLTKFCDRGTDTLLNSDKRSVLSRAANLAPCPTAWCCHLVNLTAWSQSNWPSTLKVWWNCFPVLMQW